MLFLELLFVLIAFVSVSAQEFKIELSDKNPVKPEFDRNILFSDNNSEKLPPNKVGELILTTFPNANEKVETSSGAILYSEWIKNKELQNIFGLPPEAYDNGSFGLLNPKEKTKYGGYSFVKNGFENSSLNVEQTAKTRCVSNLNNPNEPSINCLNFSVLVKQPFQIAVTIFDQSGNFITQYREKLTEQEYRNLTKEQNFTGSNCASQNSSNQSKPDSLTTDGLIKINVSIYPFSVEGKSFENGVYIAKIDRVDLPYSSCVNIDGVPTKVEKSFARYHAEQKFGWMNAKSNNK